MHTRKELHEELKKIAGDNVYFQPPPSIHINYPAIVYIRSGLPSVSADDSPYSVSHRYLITVIDNVPNSPLSEKMSWLPTVQFDRSYIADRLYHDVFTIFY